MHGETPDTPSDQQQRIERVLARARRETTTRDLLTFSLANVWVVLLALGAAVFALIHRPETTTPNDQPLDKTEESQ